ncbi:MAG TPA: hypothetical protein VIJ82_00780, partial [Streptosporangiaceae bacterium]
MIPGPVVFGPVVFGTVVPDPALVASTAVGSVGNSRSAPIFSARPKASSLTSRSCLTRASAKIAPRWVISSRSASSDS